MSVDAIIARELGLDPTHVSAVLNLLADGATIPFISRYRKEATGNMNEVNIFKIEQRNQEIVKAMGGQVTGEAGGSVSTFTVVTMTNGQVLTGDIG